MGSKKKNNTETALLSLIILVVVVIWLIGAYLANKSPNNAAFGDYFDAVSSLFAGLAFLGVIFTVWLQRKDLELTRKDLELTREELAGQRKQLEAQNETMRQERFENTFFQLLKLHTDITSAIDFRAKYGKGEVIARGRDCFKYYYEDLGKFWNVVKRDVDSIESVEQIDIVYTRFYFFYESYLGHYFRSLYNLVKFINNSNVSDKRLYTNLVRAQLSTYELLVIFYNCISSQGRDKFHPLIEKYALLKTIPEDRLFKPEHKSLYSQSAYK